MAAAFVPPDSDSSSLAPFCGFFEVTDVGGSSENVVVTFPVLIILGEGEGEGEGVLLIT